MRPSLAVSKFFLILFVAFVCHVHAQDTLHLDFGNTQTVPDKAMEDKIVAWGKTLNGQKQNIKVYAYYHKGEFKQFAQQRLDEMYLSINRKVRDLVNIKEQETKKGDNYQRTRVDIIYWAEGSVVAKPGKTDTKKTNDNSNATTTKTDNKKTDNKKTDTKKTTDNTEEDAPTTAVANPNGTGKDAGKKKGDEGKTIKYDPAKEYLDSTYVNGVLKINKKKKK
jgi:hypothetical protein